MEAQVTAVQPFSLKRKTLFIVFTTLALLVASAVTMFFVIIQPEFLKIEQDRAKDNLHRISEALNNQINFLQAKLEDWAYWDDTYFYIDQLDSRYETANLQDPSLETLRVGYILFFDKAGKLKVIKPVGSPISYGNKAYEDIFNKNSSLVSLPRQGKPISGLMFFNDKPVIVSGAPILMSDRKSEPNGSIIFIRELDSAELDVIRQVTQLNVHMWDLRRPDLPDFVKASLSSAETGDSFSKVVDSSTIRLYLNVPTLLGDPGLMFTEEEPREIFKQSQQALWLVVGFLLIAATFVGGAMIILLERNVIRRIEVLGAQLRNIQETHDHSRRIDISGNDEIEELASIANYMLSSLETSFQNVKEGRDLLHAQASQFAKQLEGLAGKRDQSIGREYDLVHWIRTLIIQLNELSGELTRIPDDLQSEKLTMLQERGVRSIKAIVASMKTLSGEANNLIATTPPKREKSKDDDDPRWQA